MLVEDEEMLRELGVMLLESDGYRVLAGEGFGVEAVEMFEAHADEIGLVVCDLGLPRLGGRDVFLRMKRNQAERAHHRGQRLPGAQPAHGNTSRRRHRHGAKAPTTFAN